MRGDKIQGLRFKIQDQTQRFPRFLTPVVFFLTLLLFVNFSYSAYIVKLKSGEALFVSTYKTVGDKIILTTRDGTITLDRGTVIDIIETKEPILSGDTEEVDEGSQHVLDEKEVQKIKEDSLSPLPVSNDGLEELRNEVNEFNTKREAIEKEREELIRKRENLIEEMNKGGRLAIPTKARSLESKRKALEEEIVSFNERFDALKKKEEELKNTINSFKKSE